jgi:hydroxypyruvate isomerase
MNKTNLLNRRSFISRTAGLAAATGLFTGQALRAQTQDAAARSPKFKLRYAPHPGTFKVSAGDNVIDQIKFAADQGFTGWEYNGLPEQTPEMQERIGKTVSDLGMKMGVFVAYGSFDEPVFATTNKAKHEEVLKKIRDAVDIAKRVGTSCFTVVPGSVDQQGQSDKWNKYGGARLAEGYQTANVIALLRRCAEILEPHQLTMVLEPLNWESNHGGVFLRHSDQAYALCKAVNSPACKILFDIYHQQITEGNLINNIERCWDEIGYFQTGDNPGRKEPGTGEINYRSVFKHIHEHGNSKPGKAGEEAVIQAYRDADAF